MSQRLRAGNRLRVALSENFWPLVWPSPRIATLAVITGVSSLSLPVRPPKPAEDPPKDEMLKDRIREHAITNPRGGLEETRSGPDAEGWVTVTKVFTPETNIVPEVGTSVTRGWTPATLTMRERDPNSCRWAGGFTAHFQRGDWNTLVRRWIRSAIDRRDIPGHGVRPRERGRQGGL